MKRNERSLFNTLRKTVTPETINVEIPEGFTLEARQAMHELLTIEKGLYAVAIYWNDIENAYCVHYERPYTETAEAVKAAQEVQTIEAVTADLPRRDMTWTGYPKTAEVTEEPEAETTEDTTEEEQEAETMNANELFARIREEVEARTTRSAWSHGVEAYALDLVDELEEATEGGYFDLSDLEAPEQVNRAMLNGARDWNQYSWGGSSLCYDGQIAERLCTPSELKKTRNGERRPNRNEEWLDVQARALFQASNRVKKAIRAALEA